MRIAIMGRTAYLLEAAKILLDQGNSLALVWTSRAEEFYGVDETDFQRLAREAGAMFRVGGGMSQPDTIELLRSLKLDAGVSINWPTRIPALAVRCFRHGILNAHAGDLPRYRGNACPNWAILNGEPHIGVCIHLMAEEIDSGAVILRDRFLVGENTYIGEVYDWFAARVPGMFSEALEGLESGRLTPRPQPVDPTLSLRCYPRRPEDSRLRWDWSVDRLYKMVRASSHPFSGAFCFLERDRRITIWRASPEPATSPFLAIPGQVCYRAGNDPVIACGDGMLRLIDVELDGDVKPGEAKALICSSLRNRLT